MSLSEREGGNMLLLEDNCLHRIFADLFHFITLAFISIHNDAKMSKSGDIAPKLLRGIESVADQAEHKRGVKGIISLESLHP